VDELVRHVIDDLNNGRANIAGTRLLENLDITDDENIVKLKQIAAIALVQMAVSYSNENLGKLIKQFNKYSRDPHSFDRATNERTQRQVKYLTVKLLKRAYLIDPTNAQIKELLDKYFDDVIYTSYEKEIIRRDDFECAYQSDDLYWA
jgi:hypothetical protein